MRWFWRLFGLFFLFRAATRGPRYFGRYAARRAARRAVWRATRRL